MSYRTRMDPVTRERYVSGADLSQEQKRKVWSHVRAHEPSQAAFLLDPLVRSLTSNGFTPRFPLATVRAALGE